MRQDLKNTLSFKTNIDSKRGKNLHGRKLSRNIKILSNSV